MANESFRDGQRIGEVPAPEGSGRFGQERLAAPRRRVKSQRGAQGLDDVLDDGDAADDGCFRVERAGFVHGCNTGESGEQVRA